LNTRITAPLPRRTDEDGTGFMVRACRACGERIEIDAFRYDEDEETGETTTDLMRKGRTVGTIMRFDHEDTATTRCLACATTESHR
jgi:hypothetical protein